MKYGMLVVVAALLMAAGSGCANIKQGRRGCAGCQSGCSECGIPDSAHGVAINAHGECQCTGCRGNGNHFGAGHGGGGQGFGAGGGGGFGGGGGAFAGGSNELGREYRASRRIQGPAGPPTAQVTYPYYTIRGPRDFLNPNPPSIGP